MPVPWLNGGKQRWGGAFKPVLTGALVNQCRIKLGMSVMRDPREFKLRTNYMCLHAPSAFAADTHGLWVGIGGQLIRLGFDGKTNFVFVLRGWKRPRNHCSLPRSIRHLDWN